MLGLTKCKGAQESCRIDAFFAIRDDRMYRVYLGRWGRDRPKEGVCDSVVGEGEADSNGNQ